MPRPGHISVILTLAALFAGCGRHSAPPAYFAVNVDERFQINPAQFACRTGQRVRIRITNVIPPNGASIAHNLVLTKAGTDVEGFGQAAVSATVATDYIPEHFKTQVLAVTRLINPGESNELSFEAPSAPGDYPILCTFPGHCILGMRATLQVR